MKIAVLSDRSYPYFKGGAEKRYWEIAKRLAAAGHEVHFFTGQWPGMPEESVVDGITLRGIFQVKQFYIDGHKSIKESLLYTLSLLPYLLAENYDLIECEQFPLIPIFIAKLGALIRNKPLVVTWHEVWNKPLWLEYLGFKGHLGALLERVAVHLPDQLISVSPQTTAKLIEEYGVSKQRITMVPNGINLDLVHRAPPASETADIVYVGRLIDHKQVDVLLRTVQVVKQTRPDVQCLIIGDGPERARLEALAKELDIEANTVFLGYLKEDRRVYSLMKSSRVMVMPSIREGFGIAVIEANACGIPALVVNHPNNASRDLVHQGINGYICALDPAQLAEKVLQILEESPLRYRDACYREAQQYSWDHIARDVEQVYLDRFTPALKKPVKIAD